MKTTVWHPARLFSSILSVGLVVMVASCGGGGDSTTDPPPPPPPPPPPGSFSLSIAGGPITVPRAATGFVTITVARTGGYAATVSLAVAGLPGGVTASWSADQLGASQLTSTLTLSATAFATAGEHTITVSGTATGASTQSVPFQLTVSTPAETGPFSLSISSGAFIATNIWSIPPQVTVIRNPGFTAPVTFTMSGLPASLTTTFQSFGGPVGVRITGTAPNGTYTGIIRGTSSQGDQLVTLQVLVPPPSTGAIRWKFCNASVSDGPYMFAVKDGDGPWTAVYPSRADTSYSFDITSNRGQVAWVKGVNGDVLRTNVYQLTAQEISATAAAQCLRYPNQFTNRSLTTSMANPPSGATSLHVSVGAESGLTTGGGNFGLHRFLPSGPLDAVAVFNGATVDSSAIPVNRMVVTRIAAAPNNSNVALDGAGVDAFDPITSTWVFNNTGGEPMSLNQMLLTANGTAGVYYHIPVAQSTTTTRTLYGAPLARTIAGDLHQVVATLNVRGATVSDPQRATRQIITYMRTLADRTLSFGPPMPAPVVSSAGGRLRAQGSLPAEYNNGVTFEGASPALARGVTIHASRGFLGTGNTYDVQVPDLTSVSGWDLMYSVPVNGPIQWSASGGGPTLDYFDPRLWHNLTRARWTGLGAVLPSDGATFYFARAFGTFLP
jgi:hypothetical protein